MSKMFTFFDGRPQPSGRRASEGFRRSTRSGQQRRKAKILETSPSSCKKEKQMIQTLQQAFGP
jgi:hypothetical protein